MSVLPFPSFLDDVKEKGLKRAIFEGVNEVTERLTNAYWIERARSLVKAKL